MYELSGALFEQLKMSKFYVQSVISLELYSSDRAGHESLNPDVTFSVTEENKYWTTFRASWLIRAFFLEPSPN